MNQDDCSLIQKMNISSDAVIINQGRSLAKRNIKGKHGETIVWHNSPEYGIGLSRNSALLHTNGDIILFSDDDVIYNDHYEDLIIAEFKRHPKADMLIFNLLSTNKDRPEYQNSSFHRVHFYNCLRYGTFRIAVKSSSLKKKRICFSTLFGGGSRYGSGEDSLFLMDCIKKKLRVYASPIQIGIVSHNCSSWFKGYTKRFFFDKGALYQNLFGPFAIFGILQFCLRHMKFFQNISLKQGFIYMCKGATDFKKHV